MKLARIGKVLVGAAVCLACVAAGIRTDQWILSTHSVIAIDPNDTLFYYLVKPPPTPKEEREAVACFVDYLSTHRRASLRAAEAHFDRIRNYLDGAAWPALQWMCQYFLLPESQRPAWRAQSPDGSRLLAWFAQTRFRTLRDALTVAYHLNGMGKMAKPSIPLIRATIEYLLFLCPVRDAWEHTDALLACMRLRPGDSVADVGSGPGYDTFRMARMVGPRGRVYAVETSAPDLAFVRFVINREHFTNVETVKTRTDDIGLPANSVDAALLCYLYHAVYGATDRPTREFFLGSIWRALKPGGRLLVAVANSDQNFGTLVLGNRIASRVVVSNVTRYGFKLVRVDASVPQRSVAIFQKPE